MRWPALFAFVATGLAMPTAAAAGPCQRPTDPGGFNGYDYGAAPVSHYDGKSVRIWYTTTGLHAVSAASTQPDMTPDNVVTAAKVGDAALASYQAMGFSPPLSDEGSGATCGGDPRLDIYLMHFNAADGDTVAEGCKPSGKAVTCWSFGQVESRLETIYGSFELGAHVVIAHELFHSVQDAYDEGLDRFWAEGTAQWAAKKLYPAEMDLESFLPSFFQNATKSIDITGGGVVANYLYGSAIWPVFLDEHLGPAVLPASFQKETVDGPPSMRAIDAALGTFGSSLADAFPTFAAWNAATGPRAGTSGYASASKYPAVKLAAFPSIGTASAIVAGYSVFYYSYDLGAESRVLTLTADPTRVAARSFPLLGGKASLDQLAALPATVSGPGVLVVAGISSKKSDAPFTVSASVPTPDGGAPDASDDAASDASDDASTDADATDADADADADAGDEPDAGTPIDADAPMDAGPMDAGPMDAETPADAGTREPAAAPSDSSSSSCGCGLRAPDRRGAVAFVVALALAGAIRRSRVKLERRPTK